MNIIEISNKFPSELEAVKYFENVRWKNKVRCPFCNSTNIGERNKDYRWHCKKCQKSFSVTSNTQLHNTRLELRQWLYAFSIVTDAKKGLSALQLKRNLKISYPTAWSIYHKIRELMAIDNTDISELDEVVEMDETYVGGKPRHPAFSKCLPKESRKKYDAQLKELKDKGFKIKSGNRKVACDVGVLRGRGTKKIPLVGIVERGGNVVAEVMRNLTYKNLSEMVKKYVDQDDSVIITDEYKGYNRLNSIIEHVKVDHKKMFSYRGLNTNSIESFWAIVKRQLIGQHHSVSPKHLPKYVAEMCFKFNNRKVDNMFETLVKLSMIEKEWI